MKGCCPIEVTVGLIGRKWAINILRDLFMGRRRFRDFLESNPDLSTKMLSTRLKELEQAGLIEKRIVSSTPVVAEYHLSETGRSLNKVLYELARFSVSCCPEETGTKSAVARQRCVAELEETFLHSRKS